MVVHKHLSGSAFSLCSQSIFLLPAPAACVHVWTAVSFCDWWWHWPPRSTQHISWTMISLDVSIRWSCWGKWGGEAGGGRGETRWLFKGGGGERGGLKEGWRGMMDLLGLGWNAPLRLISCSILRSSRRDVNVLESRWQMIRHEDTLSPDGWAFHIG